MTFGTQQVNSRDIHSGVGGASFWTQCGLPTDLIKLQGDWNSNAYERYLQPSLELRKQVASKLGAEARRIMSAKC